MDARTPQSIGISEAPNRADQIDRDGGLDVQKVVAILRRRLRLILGVALVIFGVVALVTLQATPKYTATAQVMLNQRPKQLVDVSEQRQMPDAPADSSTVDTEVQVLSSHSLARRVVDALHLDQDPEFNPRLRPHSAFVRAKAAQLAPSTPAAIDLEKERVAEAVLGGLKVTRQTTTYVMKLDYTSTSAVKSATIANAFADLYLNDQLESKFDSTRRASDWLNSHLSGLRSQAESADAAVEAYKSANGLLSADGNTLTEQQISALDTEIATARAAQAEAEARVQTAKNQLAHGSTGDDVGEALSSGVIAGLRTQRAEISRQVADMYGRYGPKHPDLLKAQRQLDDIDGQIKAEITRIISNLEAQAQVSRQRTESLEASLASSKGTLSANNGATVRLNELQRNAESVKTLYQSYLDRFKQTTAQQGIEESDARILSRAQVPARPSSPNVPINLLMGMIMGLGAGVVAVFIAEAFDQGLSTGDDIENLLDVPALAAIPLLSSVSGDKGRTRGMTPTDFITEKPLSRFAEAFRTLRTAVVYSNVDKKIQIVAVSSSVPGEGKTTTTVGLARTAALAGAKICIVDCDLRRRSVHKLFNIEPEKGLLDILSGAATLDEVLVQDGTSGAYIIPLAESAYSPKDIFGSEAMDRLLLELRERFEMVFLDTAPILAVADTAVIASKADTVLFLTRWRRTALRLVRNSLKALNSVGADVAGIALTQVDVREQVRAGYGEAAYYFKKYSEYYTDS